jgi:hypothetical protein
MLLMLALPIIIAVAAMHRYLQTYAPTNVLARRVRAQAPRWRTAAVLIVLATALLLAMHALGEAVANGAPGWLNLLVLVLAWDAIKIGLLAILVIGRCARRTVAASRGRIWPSPSGTQATNCLRAGRRAGGQWQTSTRAHEAY